MPDILTPERLLKKVEKLLERLDQQEELINEEEAAKFLGIKKVTLQNEVYKGSIPKDCYKYSVLNKRMYIKSRLVLPK